MLLKCGKPKNRKQREHIKIWNAVKSLGGITFGYSHRSHRCRISKTGKHKKLNIKRKIYELNEEELLEEIKTL